MSAEGSQPRSWRPTSQYIKSINKERLHVLRRIKAISLGDEKVLRNNVEGHNERRSKFNNIRESTATSVSTNKFENFKNVFDDLEVFKITENSFYKSAVYIEEDKVIGIHFSGVDNFHEDDLLSAFNKIVDAQKDVDDD